MFKDELAIYQYFAKLIVESITDPQWYRAELEVMSHNGSEYISLRSRYYSISSTQAVHFNPYITGTEKIEVATADLYKALKKNPDDKPFNKYKFTLNDDGTFDIEFKYDHDYEYIYSIHPDSEEYDSIEVKDMRAIKSWEGLPENHPRPWLQQQ